MCAKEAARDASTAPAPPLARCLTFQLSPYGDPKLAFAALAELLVTHGLPPETPAMLALAVSTPDQQLSHHTIGELPTLLRELQTTAPVLILYGPLADPE